MLRQWYAHDLWVLPLCQRHLQWLVKHLAFDKNFERVALDIVAVSIILELQHRRIWGGEPSCGKWREGKSCFFHHRLQQLYSINAARSDADVALNSSANNRLVLCDAREG